MERIPETITNGIRNTENFVLLTHVHPDGDALGSLLGLAEILDSLGKKVLCFLEEPVSQLYAFLPGCDRVETELSVLQTFVQGPTAT